MENTLNTPMTLYTDRVRLPQIDELSSTAPRVEMKQFDETLSDHTAIYYRTVAQADAIKAVAADPPKTVGDLWARYLKLVSTNAHYMKQLAALENGMSIIAAKMNDYADEQDWCDDYEYNLNKFNEALNDAGYSGWFAFTARQVQMRVRVERTRQVKEHVWIDMEVARGDEIDYYYATEVANEIDVDSWEIDDDHYDDSDYEVTDSETM